MIMTIYINIDVLSCVGRVYAKIDLKNLTGFYRIIQQVYQISRGNVDFSFLENQLSWNASKHLLFQGK